MSTESRIIARLLGESPPAPPAGPGDDAALVPGDVAVSVDTMIEGVHFDERLSAADVGWKLVAVNSSDIGACGRLPDWSLLALSLPRPLDDDWLDGFAAGLHAALTHFGVRLIGGDTTTSPGPISATLTIASKPGGPFITRSGGQAGDHVWVTGTLGDSAAGFLHGTPAGLAWLRRPQPPVALGAALGASGLVTAMMDLSDGLMCDLKRLCEASDVGALIQPEQLPVGPALAGVSEVLPLQVAFGEDYQLLLCAPPSSDSALNRLAQSHRISLTNIGTLTAERDVMLRSKPWPKAYFSHFESSQVC
ncbi:MAG: thiamine-phosphate kinase [Myxococcota bacterium]|nr:thiamine-phosphate kinase [Myxococcota bacterium]